MGIDVWIEVAGELDLEARLFALSDNPTPDARDRFIQEVQAELNGPKHLRESYGGGPYATKMLCREAFESVDRRARIPASVLRERLTNVTSPASRFEPMDAVVAMEVERLESDGGRCVRFVGADRTDPMTVEEAIQTRYANSPQLVQAQLARFRAFVEFAETTEATTGEPCVIKVSG